MSSALVQVGKLTMTREQWSRALALDLTYSQTVKMIEMDRSPSPSVRNVNNEPTVSTRQSEDTEGQTSTNAES